MTRRAWLFVVALLAGNGCFPKGWTGTADLSDFQTGPFTVGPYLVPLDPGHLAVVVEQSSEDPPLVEWWIQPTQTTSAAAIAWGEGERAQEKRRVESRLIDGLWVAELVDLPPDVRLSYQVTCGRGVAGPFDLVAGVGRGRPLRFAAFGDTRTGHQIHRDLIEAMAREDIAFVINSGDLVEFGGDRVEWQRFFAIESPLLARRPSLAAIGNHDVSSRRYFERYFLRDATAGGRRYYFRDIGDVRVVILDSESELRAGSEQYAFVEAALAEGAKTGRLMVLSLHYPPYSSGSHGSNLEMRSVIGELAPRFGVELVLAGHDHDYERTKVIDGVTYLVAASAGATIRRLSPSRFTEVLRTEPHFILFDIERGSLVGRAINLAGETFDSFVIPPNPPRDVR